MKKLDARKLSMDAQEQIRFDVIKLREAGMTYIRISNLLNISIISVWKFCKNYNLYGEPGIRNKKRGRKLGEKRILTKEQTKKLENILLNKMPIDFDIPYCLWSRQAIQNLILKIWSIDMKLKTISEYMKRLGSTPQKPIKIAYKQNPEELKKWIEEDFPKIKKRAYKEKAEIHWGDETRICSNSNYIRGFSPKGQTPVIKMQAKQMSINIISSITNKGEMRFLLSEEYINTESLIKFAENLCIEANRKIFLILDNLRTHYSKVFVSWVKKNNDKIEIFYLPTYCPNLNPDERLNRDLKTHFHSGPISKNKKEFVNKLRSLLIEIQKMPKRVINYFYSKFVQYAAV